MNMRVDSLEGDIGEYLGSNYQTSRYNPYPLTPGYHALAFPYNAAYHLVRS